MFTIKYRFYEPAPTPPDATSRGFTPIERITGPYDSVSSRWENGLLVVSADNGPETPGMCFGPIQADADYPRPTLWVMNAQGATIAKYDL